MSRRYDDRRWIQNPDGSFSRRVDEPEADLVQEEEVEVNATAGAIAAAQELGIDLSTVKGSGLHGKVTKADVQAAA